MFDTALIESASHPGDGRRARSLPLAAGFHAAVLGTLVVSALWSTGQAPEPTISLVFPSFPGGPPPPPPGGRVDLVRAAVPPRTRVERMPERIPDLPPISSTDVQPESNAGRSDGHDDASAGENGGGAEGMRGGVPGGLPDGDGGVATDSIAPYRPGVDGVTVPELLERVDPTYPEAARKGRIQGVVILEAVITAAGAVDEVRIVRSPSPLFDAAVEAAVRRWRYRPATLNGRAVPVLLTVTVRFGLEG